MIILNADFPAGMTIDEAIREALDFSEKHKCMLRCEINDVKISIVAGLLPKEAAVKYYRELYNNSVMEKQEMEDNEVAESQWIDVNDRLPEKTDWYLVFSTISGRQ